MSRSDSKGFRLTAAIRPPTAGYGNRADESIEPVILILEQHFCILEVYQNSLVSLGNAARHE